MIGGAVGNAETIRRGERESQESKYLRPYSHDKDFKFCFEGDKKSVEDFCFPAF